MMNDFSHTLHIIQINNPYNEFPYIKIEKHAENQNLSKDIEECTRKPWSSTTSIRTEQAP